MRVLRVAASAVNVRRFRHERFAVVLEDVRSRRLLRFVGDADRVRTDVGNETCRAFLADLHALIKLLSDHHGALGGETELSRGVLLHAGGRERRRCMLVLFAALDLGGGKIGFADARDDRVRLRFGFEIDLCAVGSEEAHVERLFAARFELCGQHPVFLRNERVDLVLAIAHDARRHGLHAACGQTLADLCPEDRADLVADDTVQNASRLLCVDEVHVDRPRLFDRVLYGVCRDLVELDAAFRCRVELQNLRKMPRNRFSLAVRVRREKDAIGFLRFLLDAFQYVSASAKRDIFRFERMLGIDAELRFRQVAHVSVARYDLELAAQKLPDCFCLCRRLNDHQRVFRFCHIETPL